MFQPDTTGLAVVNRARVAEQDLLTNFLPTFASNGRIYAFFVIFLFQRICLSWKQDRLLHRSCLLGSSPAAPAILYSYFPLGEASPMWTAPGVFERQAIRA